MASTTLTELAIRGKDQTAGAFASIGARAQKLGSMMQSAFAAAGAYIGLRGIYSGIAELGQLSDIATKTSTDVGELTQTMNALNILGIQNMGIGNLARVFDYMQKNTGRTGLDGLMATISEIGKIEDPAKRAQEAMKSFGRSGMEFLPLINAAHDGTDALEGVIAAMPRVPQSAADAGDAAKDAMDTAVGGIKSIWLQAIGAICGWFDTMFVGGIREAAAAAANWVEYNAKVMVISIQRAWTQITGHLSALGGAWGAAFGTWFNGGSFKDGLDAMANAYGDGLQEMDDDLAEMDKRNDERMKRWTEEYTKRAAVIAKLSENYGKAAKSAKSSMKTMDSAKSSSVRSTAIRNDLILAGSNEAAKLAAFGPQYQSEAKKQTELLEQIKENTGATTKAVEDANEDGMETLGG